MAVDEQSLASFSIPQGTLPRQPILWAEFRPNPRSLVRLPLAGWRIYDNECSECCVDAGGAIKLTNQLTKVNSRLARGSARRATDKLCLASGISFTLH